MFDFFSENVPKLSPKFSNDVELVSVDMEKRICVEVIYETFFLVFPLQSKSLKCPVERRINYLSLPRWRENQRRCCNCCALSRSRLKVRGSYSIPFPVLSFEAEALGSLYDFLLLFYVCLYWWAFLLWFSCF